MKNIIDKQTISNNLDEVSSNNKLIINIKKIEEKVKCECGINNNALNFPKVAIYYNYMIFPIIALYILVTYAIIFQISLIHCINSLFLLYSISFVISDAMLLFSWISFFFIAFRRLLILLKFCIFFLLISLLIKIEGVIVYHNSLNESKSICSYKKSILISFCIVGIVINFTFFVIYYLIKIKMINMTKKQWRKMYKKKKKWKKCKNCRKNGNSEINIPQIQL